MYIENTTLLVYVLVYFAIVERILATLSTSLEMDSILQDQIDPQGPLLSRVRANKHYITDYHHKCTTHNWHHGYILYAGYKNMFLDSEYCLLKHTGYKKHRLKTVLIYSCIMYYYVGHTIDYYRRPVSIYTKGPTMPLKASNWT